VGSSQCAGFKFQFNLLRDAIGHFLCACCCRPPGALRVAVLGALRSPGEWGFNTTHYIITSVPACAVLFGLNPAFLSHVDCIFKPREPVRFESPCSARHRTRHRHSHLLLQLPLPRAQMLPLHP
jgi:hypothetical protein